MGDEVQLRDVIEDDLPILFEHQMDPEANRMAAFTPRNEKDFFAHWTKILTDDTVVKKTILFDGDVAGSVVSFERDGDREVGYWIGREYWGRGIATRALSEFLDLVEMRPLYAHVAKHNVASIRVLEKCGFAVSRHFKAIATDRGEEVEEVILKLE
jgi:RimJ/RimL family protein N-acetyltransferase